MSQRDGFHSFERDTKPVAIELKDKPLIPCPIDRPEHYTHGKIECWDYIVSQGMGFLEGNVIKYVTRWRRKGEGVRDLRKARAYLDKLILQCNRADQAGEDVPLRPM